MLVFTMLRDATPDILGFIPHFLSPNDPRPAAEQINANYQHGGGWRAQPGFKLNPVTRALKYPGDPPLLPLAEAHLRDELILFYEYEYLAIIQPDNTFEVCRLD
jgi:hypothetical protein